MRSRDRVLVLLVITYAVLGLLTGIQIGEGRAEDGQCVERPSSAVGGMGQPNSRVGSKSSPNQSKFVQTFGQEQEAHDGR